MKLDAPRALEKRDSPVYQVSPVTVNYLVIVLLLEYIYSIIVINSGSTQAGPEVSALLSRILPVAIVDVFVFIPIITP